jgi:hypothetical protein
MDLDDAQYPYSYFRGRATTFTRSDLTRQSYFGGPGQFTLKGKPHGPLPLHHLATISVADLGIQDSRFGSMIPFYHGVCFECCRLDYKLPVHNISVASAPYLEVTGIDPSESSDDWPYAGYPKLLPYIPLKVQETMAMDLETFSDSVMQGIEDLNDDDLVFVIPPNPGMGVSLWGPDGDRANVQFIWI